MAGLPVGVAATWTSSTTVPTQIPTPATLHGDSNHRTKLKAVRFGNHAGGRSQSTPPRRAVSRPVAASARAAASRDMYAFVRGNARSDV